MTVPVISGLIGFASALVVGTFLNVVIGPRVQARIRRHDRWEKDLIELVTLLDHRLPHAQSAYYHEISDLRLVFTLEDDPAYDPDKVRVWKAEATDKVRASDKVVDDLLAETKLLGRRLRLLNRQAPYWRQLFWMTVRHKMSLIEVGVWNQESLDDEAFDRAWTEVEDRREDLLAKVLEIVEPMKPPRTYPTRRARSWIKAQPKRMRTRLRPTTAVESPAAESAEAAPAAEADRE